MKNFNKIFLTIFLFTSFLPNQNLVCMERPDTNEEELSHLLETTNISDFAFFEQMPDEMIKSSIYDLTFKVLDPNNRNLSISDALNNAYKLSLTNKRFRNLLKPLIDEIENFYHSIAQIYDISTLNSNTDPGQTTTDGLLKILNTNIASISPNLQILAHNLILEIKKMPPLAPKIFILFIITNHPALLKILLNKGLNPNLMGYLNIGVRKYEDRLLHLAARYDKTGQSTKLLLQYGANPNIKNTMQRTPLIDAGLSRFVKNVKLLIKYNANPLEKDAEELTVLDYCQRPDIPERFTLINNEIIFLLKEYIQTYEQNK